MAPSLDHFASDIWSKVGLAMQLGWLTVTKQILQAYSLPRQGPNDIVDRQTINVKAFVIENRLAHHLPFEYEYRFTDYEYEYETFDAPSLRGGASILTIPRESGLPNGMSISIL